MFGGGRSSLARARSANRNAARKWTLKARSSTRSQALVRFVSAAVAHLADHQCLSARFRRREGPPWAQQGNLHMASPPRAQPKPGVPLLDQPIKHLLALRIEAEVPEQPLLVDVDDLGRHWHFAQPIAEGATQESLADSSALGRRGPPEAGSCVHSPAVETAQRWPKPKGANIGKTSSPTWAGVLDIDRPGFGETQAGDQARSSSSPPSRREAEIKPPHASQRKCCARGVHSRQRGGGRARQDKPTRRCSHPRPPMAAQTESQGAAEAAATCPTLGCERDLCRPARSHCEAADQAEPRIARSTQIAEK